MDSQFNDLERVLTLDQIDNLSMESAKLIIEKNLNANKNQAYILDQRPKTNFELLTSSDY